VASGAFNKGKFLLASGGVSLLTHTIRVMLVDSSYTFDPDDQFVDDIAADEIGVSGYSRQTLANKDIVQDDLNDLARFEADDISFGALAAGETIGGAAIFRQVNDDTDSPLIAFYDLTDLPTDGGSVLLTWANASQGSVLKFTS